MPPVVHFDEAGNTGAALLDVQQPVFVLASADFTGEEAEDLLRLVRTPQTKEVKFTALRKSGAGQRRLLEFLSSPLLTPERIKISITHKRFMVVCKAVDLIEETLAYRDGIDLYERGANLAIANLNYFVTPIFCGHERFDEFLATFVQMVRTPTELTKASFFAAVRELYENCREPRHQSSFGPYLLAERYIDEILKEVDYLALDPAIGSVFHQLSLWGTQFGRPFQAVHDESKPIAAERDTFAALMDPSAPPSLIGYDRRKFEFPLRTSTLTFGNSHLHPQLQVVDLLAGAAAYFASTRARATDDDFADRLDRAGIERFTVHLNWPFPHVTPQALGTEEMGGENAVDFIARTLHRRSR